MWEMLLRELSEFASDIDSATFRHVFIMPVLVLFSCLFACFNSQESTVLYELNSHLGLSYRSMKKMVRNSLILFLFCLFCNLILIVFSKFIEMSVVLFTGWYTPPKHEG